MWTPIANLRGPAGYNATDAAEDDAAIAAFVKQSAGATATGQAISDTLSVISVRSFGAIGDGVADDSEAIRDAIAAAEGRAVLFPAGTYKVASAERLSMVDSYASLIGDESGISTIRFTNIAGGIDIGNGTDFIYQNLIRNVVIDGYNIAATPLRLFKSEEMGMVNVRVHQATTAAIEMTETSLFHSDRLQVARAPIGIKLLGSSGTLGFHDANFYILDAAVSVQGSAVANLSMTGVTFIEAVKVVVEFNHPGNVISVGVIKIDDVYVTSALTVFTIFKAVAFSALYATLLATTNAYLFIPAVTTPPLLDFTAVDNSSATARFHAEGTVLTATALGAVKLVKVHPAQLHYLFIVALRGIIGVLPAAYATVGVAGGVALDPLRLTGFGTPEGAVSAPVGSTYQRTDGGASTSLYVKQAGTGNTGWVAK